MLFERDILLYISKYRNNTMNKIMTFASLSANKGTIFIILSLIMICFEKYRYLGYSIIVSFLINSFVSNIILKPIIRRTRPYNKYPQITTVIKKPRDFSFPSGHTSSSFTFATTIFLQNHTLGIFAYILACTVAFSRMYLGVHYPTDIVGGMITGFSVATLISIYLPTTKAIEILFYLLNKI